MNNDLLQQIEKSINEYFVDTPKISNTDDDYEPPYDCTVEADSVVVETLNGEYRFTSFDEFEAAFERGGFTVDDVFDCVKRLVSFWVKNTTLEATFGIENESVIVDINGDVHIYNDVQSLFIDFYDGVFFDESMVFAFYNIHQGSYNYFDYDGEDNFQRYCAVLQEHCDTNYKYTVLVEEVPVDCLDGIIFQYRGEEISDDDLLQLSFDISQLSTDANKLYKNESAWKDDVEYEVCGVD